ncbi:MAG: ATP-binding protein [bacterium]|nr:hypothetical protein [Acidimicrobiia bacterium]MCY4650765.1 ATP-binding protein [bacterium]
MANLITNAIRAFQHSETLVEGRELKIRTVESGNELLISVTDNGPGIRGIGRADIWSPGQTTTPGGTGIGLTIVRDEAVGLGGSAHFGSQQRTKGSGIRGEASAVRSEVMLVAIVDDIIDERKTLEGELKEAGHRVIPREAALSSLDDLSEWLVEAEAEAFVCDQRLSVSNYAPFPGAEAVCRAFRSHKLPSLLVSSYIHDEIASIRRWRAGVPVLIGKDQLDPDLLNEGFALGQAELAGDIPIARIPRRTGIHIESVDAQRLGRVNVIVPGWDECKPVELPLNMIGDGGLREDVRKRQVDWLVAKVNIDAEEAHDLFFTDFERAPDPKG